MIKLLVGLRSMFAWDAVGRWFLTGFGLVGTLITILSAVVPGLPGARRWVLGSLVVVAVIAACLAFGMNRVPASQEWLVPDRRGQLKLRLRRGDLLDTSVDDDESGHIATVITMSRQLTLTGPDVDERSLIHQLSRQLAGSPAALAAAYSSVRFDSEVVFDTGEITEIEKSGTRFLLLAATSVPRPGHDATELPMGDVWAALTAVWRWSHVHNQSVRVPVIGAGRSGSALGHELLLALLVISLVGYVRESSPRVETVVDVVVAPKDWKPERIARVRGLLKGLGCQATGRG